MCDDQVVDDGMEKFFFIERLIEKYMVNDELPSYFYHYTSVAGFESILQLDKDNKADNIILWASRYDCMNDTTEGNFVNDVYRSACNELLSEKQLSREQYNLIIDLKQKNSSLIRYFEDSAKNSDDVANAQLSELDEKYKIYERFYSSECDRYICCFSKNGDSLPMWNYYNKGDKYEGYNIVFDSANFEASINQLCCKSVYFRYFEVVYNETEQKRIIKGFVSKLLNKYYSQDPQFVKDMISDQLFDWSLMFKNDCFKHEEEARLVIHLPIQQPKKGKVLHDFVIKHRFTKGLVIPYIELSLNKNCVMGVTIGPLLCSNDKKEKQRIILRKLLQSHGIIQKNSDGVFYSKVPIRY